MAPLMGSTRFLSGIRTVKQLREARRELKLRSLYTERRISDSAADTFSWDGLLSMIAAPGSAIDRVIGGIGTGLATARE